LVVIAIIAVLIGLLLPAVQKVREAASRARCANNLKQIGLAVLNYESANGAIPPTGTVSPSGNPLQIMGNFGMKTRLLPFLEQLNLFNTMNMSFNGEAPNGQNDTILITQLTVFVCPSDPNMPQYIYNTFTQGPKPVGYANYPNNIGTIARNNSGSFDGPAYIMAANLNTALAQGGTVTLASITDGTSNTGLFGEGGGYSHISTPNLKACIFSNDPDAQPDHTEVGASSNHPGGVNAAFLDGSVHFIKNTINPTTWWALASKANGEVLSSDSY